METVIVKFLHKSQFNKTEMGQDDRGFQVPKQVLRYRANEKLTLPMYLKDYEDDDLFYIVFALKGIPKIDPSIFESDHHKFKWEELYRDDVDA